MRVLILSDLGHVGGAAIACERLSEALVKQGVSVRRVAGCLQTIRKPNCQWLNPGRRLGALFGAIEEMAGRSFPPSVVAAGIAKQLRNLLRRERPNIINLHNLHKAGWSIDIAAICAEFAPVVWTLHDMWSFTGRCVYSYVCDRFISGCDDSCPTPNEYPAMPPSEIATAWEARRKFFRRFSHVTAVTPSGWLAKKAKRGLWVKHRCEVIPYGIDLEVYRPLDRCLARKALQIPDDGIPTILAIADYLQERRKGGDFLLPALEKLKRPVRLLTVGHSPPARLPAPVTAMHLGYIDFEPAKVLAYNAADLVVHAAPVDNFPNTVMEATACGVPVLAFDTCGLPEMVKPGITGWLAAPITADALSNGLCKALDDVERSSPNRDGIRCFANMHYDFDLQGKRYHTLFQSVLAAA